MSGWRGAKITGLGVVSAAGLGARALFDACVSGTSCLSPDPVYPQQTGRITDATLAMIRDRLETNDLWRDIFVDELKLPEPAARPALLTAYALMEALGDESPADLGKTTGLIFATTTGHMHHWEQDLPRFVSGDLAAASFAASFADHHLGRPLDAILQRCDFAGPYQVIASACAAGTQALALAHAWLKTGKVDRVLVGGTEVLTTVTMRGFGCFNLLTPTVAAPFDRSRAGINLSEAAVFCRLERNSDRPALGYILGGGTAMDAFDMTRPHPEGRGMYKAMRMALDQAGASAASIDWVYAHGTGTQANDLAEGTAISMLFGEHVPPVSSTKAVHGHALGASGLLETAVALTALQDGVILPTTNHQAIDPQLSFGVVTRPIKRSMDRVLKTTLGFGGINAAVVLGRGP